MPAIRAGTSETLPAHHENYSPLAGRAGANVQPCLYVCLFLFEERQKMMIINNLVGELVGEC